MYDEVVFAVIGTALKSMSLSQNICKEYLLLVTISPTSSNSSQLLKEGISITSDTCTALSAQITYEQVVGHECWYRLDGIPELVSQYLTLKISGALASQGNIKLFRVFVSKTFILLNVSNYFYIGFHSQYIEFETKRIFLNSQHLTC